MKSVGVVLRWLVEAMESERGRERDIRLKSRPSSATGIRVSRASPARAVEVRARACVHTLSLACLCQSRSCDHWRGLKGSCLLQAVVSSAEKVNAVPAFSPNADPFILRNEPRK